MHQVECSEVDGVKRQIHNINHHPRKCCVIISTLGLNRVSNHSNHPPSKINILPYIQLKWSIIFSLVVEMVSAAAANEEFSLLKPPLVTTSTLYTKSCYCLSVGIGVEINRMISCYPI